MLDEKTGELKAEANDVQFQKYMKFEAFKSNLEKVIFVDTRSLLNNGYGEPSEDPKKHIKSQLLGKTIWYNFYSKINPAVKYGKTSEINIEYEVLGIKKDRKTQSKLGREWANNIPKIEAMDDYKFTFGRSFCDPSSKIYDYAFLALMSEVSDKLMYGKTYNLKVTVYVYKDGANVAKLGEGVIGLKYEPECTPALELWKTWMSEL